MRKLYPDKINQLRAFGAIWIFSFHYYHFILHGYFQPLKSFNPFLLLVYHGYFIVYLFFALSGFLFAQNYNDKFDLILFFQRRVASIFPAFYLCLAVYYLLFSDNPTIASLLFSPFAIDITNYPNTIGHLWFINRLLVCYLCFPLFWVIHKKTGGKGLLGLWVALVVYGQYWSIKTELPLEALYGSLPLCVSHFLFAVILGFYYKKTANVNQIALFLAAMLVLGVMIFHVKIWRSPFKYSEDGIFWYYSLVVWISLFIYYYSRLSFRLPNVLNGFVNQLGKLSYNIYLYHFLVIQFVITYKISLFSKQWANFILLFFVTLVIAYCVRLLFSICNTTYQMFIGFWGVKN